MGNEKDDSDSSVKVISDKSSRDRKKEFKHKKLSDNHNSDSSVEVILDKNPKDKKKELKRKKHNDKYKSDSSVEEISDKSSKEKKKEVKHKKYNDKYNSDSSVDEITDKSSKDKRTEFQRKKYIDKYNSDSSIEEIGEKISSKDENKESKRKKYREESNSSAEENNEKNLSKERNKDSKRKKYDDDIEERSRKPRRTSPRESRDYNRRNRNDRYEYHRRNREYKRMMNYRDLDNPREEYPRYWGSKKKPENKSDDEINEKFIGNRYYGDDKSKNRNSENKNQESDDKEKVVENDPQKMTLKQKKTVDLLTTKTGGAYIPPAKLRMMQAQITDKSSVAYQRISWEALKKSIHGYINKVNVANIRTITRELLRENIVRGRGLLCKSIIQAQAASPTFTHVYAALVSIINSKFPNIGELLLKRLVLQFKRGFKRNDKSTCISSATFVAHLVNQRVAHEILALEILTLLVESPTDDSVEVAIAFLKESGQKLTEVSSKGINAIFEMLRNILHEGQLDKRVQYMIEVMFQIRKDGFKDHVAVMEELDIVEEDDQFTHLVTLDDVKAGDDILNVFRFDGEFLENEDKYKALSKEILGSDSSSGSEDGSGESSDEEEEEKKEGVIIDNTETNLLALRRTIYLTIQSSLDFEECAHKLMKMQLKPGQESELCHMFLDCCAEQRTYEKFYGLLAQRFCQINRIYVAPFEQIFRDSYSTLHRLDINKLRNVSKFFAHLLFTDAISWDVLNIIKLNKDDTTSSSRIFIKIVFQELAEYMGLSKLNERLKDQTLQESFAGIFPRDNPKNTRFAINFFTSIGLGGLTDELREHLKSVPTAPQPPVFNGNEEKEPNSSTSSDTSSSSSSSDSSSSSNSSDSDSSSSSEEERKKRKKNKNKLQVEKKTKHIVKEKKSKEKGHNKKQKKSTKSRKDKR